MAKKKIRDRTKSVLNGDRIAQRYIATTLHTTDMTLKYRIHYVDTHSLVNKSTS